MTNLTLNQQKVLDVLTKRKEEFVTGMIDSAAMGPTAIGLALGKDYVNASSSVTPQLKKLVQLGLVRKLEDRTYEFNQDSQQDASL